MDGEKAEGGKVDALYDSFHEMMEFAQANLEEGKFIQCGANLGGARILAVTRAFNLQFSNDGDNAKGRWEERIKWAEACIEDAKRQQACVEDGGDMAIRIPSQWSNVILGLSSRMEMIPHKVMMIALNVLGNCIEAIDDGHEVHITGPGLQMRAVPSSLQGRLDLGGQ